MSFTGLDVFDHTIQTTNLWLKELMEKLETDDRHRAYLALRSVLHAVRDRLTVDEAAHLGAQLPMLVRGIYYEGYHPANRPVKERTREEFLAHIVEQFRKDPEVDPERIARAVFSLLNGKITKGEIEDVRHSLPKPIRELWPGD
jgi:uncharacterized protein (DUF2267 family)